MGEQSGVWKVAFDCALNRLLCCGGVSDSLDLISKHQSRARAGFDLRRVEPGWI